ncbi:DUF1841 family protein [Alkalilimnicola ehrlichii]|uniref:DUF1841 domain-containing protein n=1 Tax=Alkalilimnicola ehrlichii TaxID=351052 RepID=A0A3E0WFF5_9GAMM|nr:DUF1841 family protein [Alkalilimnicola ehrlichii]RFA31674.1 hypothetical protein CAL65_21795 [Alkalilimnicola ehrlichii]
MFFSQDRNQIRRFYLESWRKARERLPMEPLEQLVADVVAEHPEYHALLENEAAVGYDFRGELGQTNPFLHMGMHIALREQISTNRPPGVRAIHKRVARALGSQAEAEHAMMDCLAEALWTAQQTGGAPDEQRYLQALKELERRVTSKR